MLLLHGSGAGASTVGNWRKVLAPLAAAGFKVHAMDLIGFGRSGRKPQEPYFDYDLWLDQGREMLDRIPGETVGLIGHSLSGSLALRLAIGNSRIRKVLTTGTMGAHFEANPVTLALWKCPDSPQQLREAAEMLIADDSLIDDDYLENRAALLFSGDYHDYFNRMFRGNCQRFIDRAALSPDELSSIHAQVLLIHGQEDRGYPAAELSLVLGRSLSQADVVLLGRCSHSVAFEQPEKFLHHATAFFAQDHRNG
ncbi:MAG: alpha/beta fold hydrolase [Pigmentiphaga sp.]